MKFKKFRYNLITIGLIAIICCCVALPIVTGSVEVNQGSIEEPSDDVILPIEPSDPENPDNDVEDEDQVEEEEIPSSASDLIAYSLNLLYNGKGFKSAYTQNITNVANILGTDFKVVQSVKGNVIRNGADSLQENYFWSNWTGPGKEQLKNEYQFYYIDGKSKKLTYGSTQDYSKDKMTYNLAAGNSTEITLAEGYDKFYYFVGDDFLMKAPQTKKGDIIYSDKEISNYREIQVIYNIKNVPKNLIESYGSTGQLKDIEFNKLTITYKINIKTGKMMCITKNQNMTATNPAMGVRVTSTVSSTQTFSSVDKEQNVVCPK